MDSTKKLASPGIINTEYLPNMLGDIDGQIDTFTLAEIVSFLWKIDKFWHFLAKNLKICPFFAFSPKILSKFFAKIQSFNTL